MTIRNNDNLIAFIDRLKLGLQNNTLSALEIQKIIDLYSSFNFKKEDTNEEELKRYLFMGWYVYQFIKPPSFQT